MSQLRSFARYLAVALGDDFEVRLADSYGARPWARVSAATPVASLPLGARHVERRQTLAAVAYPVGGLNPESSMLEAMRVQGVLVDAISAGVEVEHFSPRSGRRHPMRLPLYDYEGVAIGQPAPPENFVGFARVLEPPSANAYPDPEDGRLAVVTLDVRLGWTEGIADPPSGATLESVTVGAREG